MTWKTYISQPTTVGAIVEMMKTDAAYHVASGTGMRWMDLTNRGWFDSPHLVEPIRRLKATEEGPMSAGRSSSAEIAFIVDESPTSYHAYRAGLNMARFLILKQWHLGRLDRGGQTPGGGSFSRPDLMCLR